MTDCYSGHYVDWQVGTAQSCHITQEWFQRERERAQPQKLNSYVRGLALRHGCDGLSVKFCRAACCHTAADWWTKGVTTSRTGSTRAGQDDGLSRRRTERVRCEPVSERWVAAGWPAGATSQICHLAGSWSAGCHFNLSWWGSIELETR